MGRCQRVSMGQLLHGAARPRPWSNCVRQRIAQAYRTQHTLLNHMTRVCAAFDNGPGAVLRNPPASSNTCRRMGVRPVGRFNTCAGRDCRLIGHRLCPPVCHDEQLLGLRRLPRRGLSALRFRINVGWYRSIPPIIEASVTDMQPPALTSWRSLAPRGQRALRGLVAAALGCHPLLGPEHDKPGIGLHERQPTAVGGDVEVEGILGVRSLGIRIGGAAGAIRVDGVGARDAHVPRSSRHWR